MTPRYYSLEAPGGTDAPEPPAELPLPDHEIDGLADEIADLVRRSELRCAFEVGRLVVQRFFGGDVEAVHRRGPKDLSVARLAARLRDRGVRGTSVLRRCIATYEVLAPMGEVTTWAHLSPSHLRAVLALPRPERETLLREAERERWPVRVLERAAAERPRRARGGRRAAHEYVRRVRELSRAAAELVRASSDRSALAAIHPAEHERAFSELVRTVALLERGLHVGSPKALRGSPRRGGPLAPPVVDARRSDGTPSTRPAVPGPGGGL